MYLHTPYRRDDIHASPNQSWCPEEHGLCNKPVSSSYQLADFDSSPVDLFLWISNILLELRGWFETHLDIFDPGVQKNTIRDLYLARMIYLSQLRGYKHKINKLDCQLEISKCEIFSILNAQT